MLFENKFWKIFLAGHYSVCTVVSPFDDAWDVLKTTLPIGPIDAPYWNTFGRTERQLEVTPGRARNQREQLMREPRFEGDEEEPVDTRVLGEGGYWGKDLAELQRDQEDIEFWNEHGHSDKTSKYKLPARPYASVLPPPKEVNQSLKEAADAWAKKQFEDASYGEKLRMFDEDTARQTSATPSAIWEEMLEELKSPGTRPLGTSLSRLTTPYNLEQIGDSNLL